MINFQKFKTLSDTVVDKLEGGYYHPNMLKDGRVKDSRYKSSGETMFGIDRDKGGTINDTADGVAFWKAIDNANAKNKWPWLYKGGSLAPTLLHHVAKIQQEQFNDLANRYLSKESLALIANDDRLLFNFIYATWNGSGWFKKFATDFNKKVASGERNSDRLVEYAIKLRTEEGLKPGSSPNSLIKQGGNKIASFINSLKNVRDETIKSGKFAAQSIRENPIVSTLLFTTLVLASWYLIKTIKNK